MSAQATTAPPSSLRLVMTLAIAGLLSGIVEADDFAPFLTLPAYRELE